jgi:hypothetical protein
VKGEGVVQALHLSGKYLIRDSIETMHIVTEVLHGILGFSMRMLTQYIGLHTIRLVGLPVLPSLS